MNYLKEEFLFNPQMDKKYLWVISPLKSLMSWIEEKKFTGYDIYDGLMITESRKINENRILNPLITQFFKRFPLNLRKMFGIKKTAMPKAMGLFLHSYSLLISIYGKAGIKKEPEELKEKANYLKYWLLDNSLDNYSGACWNFGFNYKFMFDAPTLVITAIVAKGLFEYYKLTHDNQLKNILLTISNFIINDLFITENKHGICFSYTPLKRDCCFNANMLGAELLAKLFSITEETKLLEYARKAVDFTLAYQYDDGHWDYSIDLQTGTSRKQVDFHQGYVIESLFDFMKYSDSMDKRYSTALKKGIEFYRREQFFDDGRSKWRIPKVWPVDIHNQAQGIITFSKLSVIDNNYLQFAKTIAQWTILKMRDKKGYFYYRKNRYYMNKISYMRWSQAWMMLALVSLLDKLDTDS